jgi:hypothetical protein
MLHAGQLHLQVTYPCHELLLLAAEVQLLRINHALLCHNFLLQVLHLHTAI